MNQSINPARRPPGVSVSVGAGGLTQWQPAASQNSVIQVQFYCPSVVGAHQQFMRRDSIFLYGLWRS